MDCVPEDECAGGTDGDLSEDLVFAGAFGEGFFLFYGDIAKFCRIKYFTALLALDKLCIFLAGDDLDYGMFALDCHWGRHSRMVWILPVFAHLVNCEFSSFCGENCGEVMVIWW
jgi:hypothetical protein